MLITSNSELFPSESVSVVAISIGVDSQVVLMGIMCRVESSCFNNFCVYFCLLEGCNLLAFYQAIHLLDHLLSDSLLLIGVVENCWCILWALVLKLMVVSGWIVESEKILYQILIWDFWTVIFHMEYLNKGGLLRAYLFVGWVWWSIGVRAHKTYLTIQQELDISFSLQLVCEEIISAPIATSTKSSILNSASRWFLRLLC